MAMGVQVIVKDPKEIEAIRQREMDITKERIMKIIEVSERSEPALRKTRVGYEPQY